jgi:hypothetical protein
MCKKVGTGVRILKRIKPLFLIIPFKQPHAERYRFNKITHSRPTVALPYEAPPAFPCMQNRAARIALLEPIIGNQI